MVFHPTRLVGFQRDSMMQTSDLVSGDRGNVSLFMAQ
jgi:hypothetical protein